MTDTSAKELNKMVRVAGPEETARTKRFLDKVEVIPDNPWQRAIALKETKKVGANDKIIFGTGNNIHAPTITSDAKFLRGAEAQRVKFDAIVHDPVPLTGK